jgi:uncharacterized membrane protein
MKKFNIFLFALLIAAIVIASGFIIYFYVTPQKVNEFTEFYVLNSKGKPMDYPERVTVGSPVDVIIGVVNQESKSAAYQLSVVIGNTEVKRVEVGTLGDKQKWEESVSFVPEVAGEHQSVDFILYRDGGTQPYLKDPLRLYLDVVPAK